MVQSGSNPTTTESEPRPVLLDPNTVGHSRPMNAQGDDLGDDVALRGVVAIDIAREVIARFSGTLILNELPERQPEIVFDRGRPSQDDHDE